MKKISGKNENGSALLIVLSTMMVMGLLAASIVVLSQSSRIRTAMNIQLDNAFYRCESIGTRAVWMLLDDMENYPDRDKVDTEPEFNDVERFMANGRSHFLSLEENGVEVRIYDYFSGMILDGAENVTPGKQLEIALDRLTEEPEERERFYAMGNVLDDYLDEDGLSGFDGLEEYDYRKLKIPALPRNRKMERQEELAYIRDLPYFFPPDEFGCLRYFNLMVPTISRPAEQKPQILSVSREYLLDVLQLDEMDEKDLLKRWDEMKSSQKTFDEVFSDAQEMLGLLEEKFSFSESGYYLFEVRPESGMPGKLLQFVIKIPSKEAFQIEQTYFYYWQLL